MKRQTMLRMLKKRLAESKRSVQTSYDYQDTSSVYGNDVTNECESHRDIMNRDIQQLEFLIYCLKNMDDIKKNLNV